jgi:predicted RNA-binding protein associated with RNAse of E/G family
MKPVTVIKKNTLGQETWRYDGVVLRQQDHTIVIEAHFNRPDTPFHGILLKNGDRFIETYFTDRWYNIMEIHDRQDDTLKGWYCNVTYPAQVEPGIVSYVDLALDLLVYPNGEQLVLDEDEFAELDLSDQDQALARAALAELQKLNLAG